MSRVKPLPRILIVDDEALLRLVLADFLDSAGFNVVEAASADEALLTVERESATIDLVFTDIRMPGKIDGFQLALWMQQKYPLIPVFLTSGYIGKEQTCNELAPGQPFFPKPYNLDNIASRIRVALA